MSTPSDHPAEPAESTTSPTPPVETTGEAPPPAGPSGPPPGWVPASSGPPPGWVPAAFTPVPRAPRVPWFNPQRKAAIVGGGVAAALVLLGAGFGIGYAVAPSGHHDRYGPAYRSGFGPEMHGRYLPDRLPRGEFPFPRGPQHMPTPTTPSASPS
jgi:hypothetical protein